MMAPTSLRIVPRESLPATDPLGTVSIERPMMGGRVGVHLAPTCRRQARGSSGADPESAAVAAATLRRIAAWADRLTRFTTTSELSRLNGDRRSEVPVGPTLAAALDWGRVAEGLTDGIVDIGLLDERLAAEGPSGDAGRRVDAALGRSAASRAWSLDRGARGAVVRRPVGFRFDLDGIAKGWLADRALDRLGRYPAAIVDADGDVALRLETGRSWSFGVADPRGAGHNIAILTLAARGEGSSPGDGRFGLATSGTSVHRWVRASGTTHHLIDPRTGRSAQTDVIQATVLARSSREAEALAKAAVIVGSDAACAMLDRVGVDGALLLTDRSELIILPATERWLS